MQVIQNLPGEAIQFEVDPAKPSGEVPRQTTLGTKLLPFELVEPMLTSEPCRRPNRNRPIPEDELEAEDAAFIENSRKRLARQRDQE